MRPLHTSLAGAIMLMAAALPSRAATVTLSDYSSSSRISASDLDATLDFQIVNGQLQLTVTNTSTEFRINRILFNGTSDITGLTLVNPAAGWNLSPKGSKLPRSGKFDFQLLAQARGTPGQLEPGQSETFIFNVSGVNVDATDFTTDATLGQNAAIAGAQFINIGGGNSRGGAWGLRRGNQSSPPPPPDRGGDGQQPPPNGGSVPLPAPLAMGLVLLSGAGLFRRKLGLR